MPETTTGATNMLAIEEHSIDFIPLNERHGRPRDMFTLFFGGGVVVASIGAGALFVSPGASFIWTVVAMVIGLSGGCALAAFHAAQGPTLGIPQMIQSRAQFGFRGSIFAMIMAEFIYIGFFASNPSASALLVVGGAPSLSVIFLTVVIAVLCALVALFGYNFSHALGKVLTVVAIVVYLVAFLTLIFHNTLPNGGSVPLGGSFSLGLFLGTISFSFIFAAGYAPYVADYSRYLRPDVSVGAVSGWTYLGIWVGELWLLVFGALLGVEFRYTPDVFGALFTVVSGLGLWFAWLFVTVTCIVTVLQGSFSLYAGVNTALSLVQSLNPRFAVTKSCTARIVAMVPVFALALAASIAYANSFFGVFGDFLSVAVLFLLPWSAVNLVDFYFVRRRHYVTAEIFKPNGMYGSWNWPGLVSWLVGAAVAVPFANLTFWVGPIANAVNGGDLSWFVAPVVGGGLYLVLARRRLGNLRAGLPRDGSVADGGQPAVRPSAP